MKEKAKKLSKGKKLSKTQTVWWFIREILMVELTDEQIKYLKEKIAKGQVRVDL